MKKYLCLYILCVLLIAILGCPQKKESVKPQPPLPPKQPSVVTTPKISTEEEKPEITETPPLSEAAEPNLRPKETLAPNETKPKPEPAKNTLGEFNQKYASVLMTYVDEEGKVDYSKLRLKRLDLIETQNIIRSLKPQEYKTWSEKDKIAFWINAYNLEMLKIIVQNYPIESYRILHVLPSWSPDSVRHIDRRINGIKKQKFIIMEEEFTLESIEERFFNKEFNDPRIFFAISFYCTTGGPPLRNEPYNGKKLDKQLDDQVRTYISSRYGFGIDEEDKTVHLSPILKKQQFGQEFLKKYGTKKKFKDHPPVIRAVLNFLINYLPKNQVNFLETRRYDVKFIILNWNLNEQ